MINGLSGRPGSGKSYEAVVRHILPALQKGRKVVTNIPLNVEWFCAVVGPECEHLIEQIDGGFHNYGGHRYFSQAEHFLRYQDWRNYKNQGVFFVVDECHLAMPAASKDGPSTQQELKEYMSMHRHYGHDILLLSQNFRKVDRDIRDMVQNCYLTTKKSFLGQDDKYICKVAEGVSRNIVATHEREYESKYFAAYKSHTKSEGSVQEAGTVDVKVWWKNKFTYGAFFMLLLFLYLITTAFSQKSAKDKEIAALQERKKQELASHSPTQPAQVQSTKPQTIQTNSTQKTTKQTTEPDSEKSHPLQGLYLSITGMSADWTSKGRFQKLHYIAVSRNGQMLSEISTADLALAGYQVKVLNDCMMEIKYSDAYKDFLFCDQPTQVGQLATNPTSTEGAG